jgi:P-type E1-E2 ATPase
VIEAFATKAYRTLTLSYKDIPIKEFEAKDNEEFKQDWLENELTLIAVVGIIDPLRPEVVGAIKACGHAGINVRMVTGDNKTTAVAIAQRAGILPPDS